MTRDDVVSFLDSLRKDDSEDIMHEMDRQYNLRLTVLYKIYQMAVLTMIWNPLKDQNLT